MITPDRDIVKGVIQRLRSRARSLRRAATATLLLIIGVLAAGLAIFLLAGELANREARRALVEIKQMSLDSIEARLRRVNYELSVTSADIDKYRAELDKEREGVGRPGLGPRSIELMRMLGSAEARQVDLMRELRNIEEREDIARRELRAARTSGNVIGSESETAMLISVIVTRISSIVLLLFLVQILVPLYRYNTRLAAYYEARGDALEIVSLDDPERLEGLERLVASLSPDSVTFGQHPATPVDKVLGVARSALSKGGNR